MEKRKTIFSRIFEPKVYEALMTKLMATDTPWIALTVTSGKEERLFLEDTNSNHGDCRVFLAYTDARQYAEDLVSRKILPAESLNSKTVSLESLTSLVKSAKQSSPEKRFTVSLYQGVPNGELTYVDTLVDSQTN